MTAGGVYRSDDGGDTWVARNQGLEAKSLTDEVGGATQCVHKLAVDALNPDVLWAQSHWGIFRTDDGGDRWKYVGRAGEPAAYQPTSASRSSPIPRSRIPLSSAARVDVYRCTPKGRCRVYRTIDSGLSWEALSDGLPGTNAHLTVLRDAFTIGDNPPSLLVFVPSPGTYSPRPTAVIPGVWSRPTCRPSCAFASSTDTGSLVPGGPLRPVPIRLSRRRLGPSRPRRQR